VPGQGPVPRAWTRRGPAAIGRGSSVVPLVRVVGVLVREEQEQVGRDHTGRLAGLDLVLEERGGTVLVDLVEHLLVGDADDPDVPPLALALVLGGDEVVVRRGREVLQRAGELCVGQLRVQRLERRLEPGQVHRAGVVDTDQVGRAVHLAHLGREPEGHRDVERVEVLGRCVVVLLAGLTAAGGRGAHRRVAEEALGVAELDDAALEEGLGHAELVDAVTTAGAQCVARGAGCRGHRSAHAEGCQCRNGDDGRLAPVAREKSHGVSGPFCTGPDGRHRETSERRAGSDCPGSAPMSPQRAIVTSTRWNSLRSE
jgi:hypothetical protein